MRLTLIRQWVRYRLVFKLLFFGVLGLGVFMSVSAQPPRFASGTAAYYVHAGGLLICSVLSYLAFPRWYWWARGILLFLVGVAVEYAQSFQPTRYADIADIYANTAGVVAGLILVGILQFWLARQTVRS